MVFGCEGPAFCCSRLAVGLLTSFFFEVSQLTFPAPSPEESVAATPGDARILDEKFTRA
jgi:hypothetical protein